MKKSFIATVAILTLLTSCSSSQNSASWSEGMRGMAQSFEKLFPYMYDYDRYSDTQYAKFITTRLDELNTQAASLDKHIATGLSGDDPLFDIGLKGLKRNLKRARESYFVQSYDYSQKILQSSINYCVQCHTRTAMGPSFNAIDSFSEGQLAKIDKFELAKLQVATRQFNKAIATLEVATEETEDYKKKIRAVKLSLAIAIRNLNDTNKALEAVNIAMKNKSLAPVMADMKTWKKALQSKRPITLKSALRSGDTSPTKSHNFVTDLKNSLVLHQSLSSEQNRATRAKIFFRLGQIYSAYPTLAWGELPEEYYEACIYENPFSQTSRQCYFSMERKLRQDYRLTMNEPLPKEDQAAMIKLKALTVKKKPGSRPMGGHQTL